MQNLQKLAETAGISSSYVDKTGKTHYTTDEVRRYFLENMGYKAQTQDEINSAIELLTEKKLLPPVMSFYENEKVEFFINGCGDYSAELTTDEGMSVWRKMVEGGQKIQIDNLDIGYYKLKVKNSEEQAESLIIYAPEKCWQPEFIQKKEHIFGTAVMLYALRSENNMGIGDFGDLAEIVKITAQNGGDVVGINPLGVMSPFTQNEERFASGKQSDVSPYRTLSRLFVNYIYLDLPAEDDFKNSSLVRAFMQLPETQTEIKDLRESNQVQYAKVLLLKKQILEMMFAFLRPIQMKKEKMSLTNMSLIREKN